MKLVCIHDTVFLSNEEKTKKRQKRYCFDELIITQDVQKIYMEDKNNKKIARK